MAVRNLLAEGFAHALGNASLNLVCKEHEVSY